MTHRCEKNKLEESVTLPQQLLKFVYAIAFAISIILNCFFSKVIEPSGFHVLFKLLFPSFFFGDKCLMKFLFKSFQQCFFCRFLTLDFWNVRNSPQPVRPISLDMGGIGFLEDLVLNFDSLYFFHGFLPSCL